MTTTTIFVHTSAASAVLTASQHGKHELQVDLSTWSADERAWLAAHTVEWLGACFAHPDYQRDQNRKPPNWIDVAPPTVERLREIVLTQMAEDLRKAAERAVEEKEAEEAKRKRIQDAIEYLNTCPIAEMLKPNTTEPMRAYWLIGPLRSEDTRDLAIDLVPHRRPEFEDYVTEIEAKKEAEKAAREAKRFEKEAAEEHSKMIFAHWLRENWCAEQAERFEAGVLPLSEAKAIIRSILVIPTIQKEGLEQFLMFDRPHEMGTPQTFTSEQWKNIKKCNSVIEAHPNIQFTFTTHVFNQWIHDPENEDADRDGDITGEDTPVGKFTVTFCGIETVTYVVL